MNKITATSLICCALAIPSICSAAVNVFKAGSSDFNDTSSWSLDSLPGNIAQGNTLIQFGRDATASANHTPTVGDVNLVIRSNESSENQSSLSMAHDLDTGLLGANAGSVQLGSNGGFYGTLNQSAGVLTTGTLLIGDSDGTAAFRSYYQMTGGSISTTSLLIRNDAIFSFEGMASTVSAQNMTLSSTLADNPILEFKLGGVNGINAIDVSGLFTIGSTSKLIVDGTGYTGGAKTIDLVTFGAVAGSFIDPANITLTGFSEGSSIGYDGDSMFITAVPEPTSSVLIGFGGIALMLRRQR